MSNLKGQEVDASQFKPHDEGANPNIFGEHPEVNLPASADLVKLQSAITDLAAALIELDVSHNSQGSAILREGLNAALSSSKVLRSTFFKGIFDAAELTFIDELIKGAIENGRSAYNERSAFRKEVLALVKKYSDELHYRSTFYPYDQDGLIERRAQLTRLLRADITIPYPNPNRMGTNKFSNAYPDEDFIKVVEEILSSGKRYYSLFLDAAFNTFLDDLHELNKKRHAHKQFAHTDTSFASKETLLDLVKILAVAYNKLSKDFDAFYKASTRAKDSSYLLTDALVAELESKQAILRGLLSESQRVSYESMLKDKGLTSQNEDDEVFTNDPSVLLRTYSLSGDQTKIIRAEVATLWDEIKKQDHLKYRAAVGSQQLLPIVQQEKEHLEIDNARLNRQLSVAELQADSLSKENAALRAKNAELALASESAELEHQEEIRELRELFSKQIQIKTMVLERLQLALEKIGIKKSQSTFETSVPRDQLQDVSELRKLYEIQISELQQEIDKLKLELSKAKPPARKRLSFGSSDSVDSGISDKNGEQKIKAHVDSPARFDFSSDGEESSCNPGDAKIVGTFTPEKSSISCE
ncbi:MAG: hypothetical protein K2X50_05175 [Gammaproteobacteria bacterium]|nr:hypothetical protein [Gammaproteobacteria bacterium]